MDSEKGPVCTKTCFDDCPEGWTCKEVTNTGADVTFVCIQSINELCKPCHSDGDCGGNIDTPDKCLSLGEAGSFCGVDCSSTGKCLENYTCADIPQSDGSVAKQCIPVSGKCPCLGPYDGMTTPCTRENQFGSCVGESVCDGTQGAWSECDADEPKEEICDGEDNNCSGLADDELPALECEITNEHGVCLGKKICISAEESCDAKTPTQEFCDLEDNDCDGQTDEDLGESSCGLGICAGVVAA
ncbi:MAG TPA: hypothetical protein EYN66_00140, partial [Myxococcales bacterium]|nr:hypothetical protein [Myxococcales bacterium]